MTIQPDYLGPYNATTRGICDHGHALNNYGRCRPLNELWAASQVPPVELPVDPAPAVRFDS
jgi:hypothetical protein